MWLHQLKKSQQRIPKVLQVFPLPFPRITHNNAAWTVPRDGHNRGHMRASPLCLKLPGKLSQTHLTRDRLLLRIPKTSLPQEQPLTF